jgi:SAM-dependent methyltransferase
VTPDDTALEESGAPTRSTEGTEEAREQEVEAADQLYLAQVRREIDAEVRRRRAAGDFPPSFERKLDELFARFTPVGSADDRFSESLKLADRSAYFDTRVPVGSRRRPRGFVKWTLWQAEAWFVNYVVSQLNHFSASVMRVLHLVDDRLDDLEQDVAALQPPVFDEEILLAGPDLTPFLDLLTAHLSAPGRPAGRVLHTDCGDGDLLARLVSAGVDAYGVDPGSASADRAVTRGLDVRRDDTLGHLGAVGSGTLSGLVLSGGIDRLSLAERRRLLVLAEGALAPGGTLVLVGTDPRVWVETVGPVAADLSAGRPLYPETWMRLFEEVGFTDRTVHPGPVTGTLERVPDRLEGAAVLNAALGRLETLVAGPASYAVVATRRP